MDTLEIKTSATPKTGMRPSMNVVLRIGETREGIRVLVRRRTEVREITLGTPEKVKTNASSGFEAIIKDFSGIEYIIPAIDILKLF